MSCFCCGVETQGYPRGTHRGRHSLCLYSMLQTWESVSNQQQLRVFQNLCSSSEDTFEANLGSQALDHLHQRWGGNGGRRKKASKCKAPRGGRRKQSLPELAFNSPVKNSLGWEWLFDLTTCGTALTNVIALQQCVRWHSFPHRQYLHSNNNSTASAAIAAGSIEVGEPTSHTGNMIYHSLSKANLFSQRKTQTFALLLSVSFLSQVSCAL